MDILGRLFAIAPIRKAIWRLWYPFLTRRLRDEEVLFLNYAFESDPPVGLELKPDDEPFRANIQLYHHVASQVDLKGKEVLEVSCGHGGGASWISRTTEPESYTGLDLNPAGVQFCQSRYPHGEGLRFIRGDAMKLPFADSSLDAVINVEASHCYPDFPAFLAEVKRVLRPGGHFLYADFRFHDGTGDADWLKAIEDCGMDIVHARDISAEVKRGMEVNAERSQNLVERCLPKPLRSLGRDFAGVPGGQVYDALAEGELSYRSWCLVKTG